MEGIEIETRSRVSEQAPNFRRQGISCSAPASSSLTYDDRLGGFVVCDSMLIAEILHSNRFQVVDYARHYLEISKRTGLDFAASVAAMEHMPLANEGPAHRELRTRSARAMSDDWRENAADMERHIFQLVDAAFGGEGDLDLVGQLAVPIFNHLYRLWSGVTLDRELRIAEVFCGRMSLNRRQRVDAGLRRLDHDLNDSLVRVPKDVAMSFAILASDSLVGSLALSLWTLFSENDGNRISDIPFPETLPSTAVPYIDRIATEDVEIIGISFSRGQRARLMLQATAVGECGRESDLFFGAGRHLCVGKAMTNLIWKSVCTSLAQTELRVRVVGLAMRRPDHVFHYPKSAKVVLYA
jgi:hypothetical protein